MKKLIYLSMALTISMGSLAYAARSTFTVLVSDGTVANYCSDDTGVHVNPDGTGYLLGATLGACQPVNPPPPVFNQLTRASVSYQYANGTVPNVDMTQMKNIWGRVTSVDPIHDYPFRNGSTPTFGVGAGKVVAAQFTIPVNATPSLHQLKNPSYFSTPGVTVAFSTVAGDFNPSQTACVKHNAANDDSSMITVRVQSTVGANPYFCYLLTGRTYYLNLKYELPTRSGNITTTWN